MEKLKHTRTIQLVRITPDDAAELLNKNYKGQRNLKKANVNQFTRLIEDGEWDAYKGEIVKVTRDGILIDGQHRLTACINAGKPIEVLYCDEYDIKDHKFIDAGAARTPADALGGAKGANNAAAFIRLVILAERHGTINVLNNNNRMQFANPGNAEVAEFAEENPWVYDHLKRCESIRKSIGAGSLAAYAFFMYTVMYHSEEKARDFFDQLESDYCTDTTFAVFKKRMLKDKAEGKRLNSPETLQMLAVAWNAFYEGRELTKIYPRKVKELRGMEKA